MKSFLSLILLFSVSACGVREESKKLQQKVAQPLKCVIPTAVNGVFTPAIRINQTTVDMIMADLQGRPFHRNSFWNMISRESRLEINLELQRDLKIPEEIIYRGFALFIENYINHPGQNYYLNSSQYRLRYVISESLSANSQETCENQDRVLADIDISKLITIESQELRLRCTVETYFLKSEFLLSVYRNHILVDTFPEKALFAGGEIIRQEDPSEFRISALDPKQRTLSMKLSKNEDADKVRKVALLFSGKTTSIEGNGTCINLRK